MCSYKQFSLSFAVCLLFVGACSSVPPAQSPLKTLNSPQGGTIVYGLVNGATSPATAMAQVLRSEHNTYGEKPQVGNVFRVRSTNSHAVFFTVVNHPGGNVQVAGMLIAAPTGPNKVEAGLVSDAAARFASTMNPMLSQLFSVWHPGGAAAPTGKTSAPAAGGGAALPPMRQVSLPDRTATVSVPAGWNIVPNQSGMGITNITGPQGELLGLNLYYLVWDPYNPSVQNRLRRGLRFPNEIDYPTNADLTKSFADILQRGRPGPGPSETGERPGGIRHTRAMCYCHCPVES